MDHAFDDRGVERGQLRRGTEDGRDARAGVGESRHTVSIFAVLVDQARNFVGKVPEQLRAAAQLVGQGHGVGNVGGHAAHAQGIAFFIAADNAAAADHPFVAAILAAQAVFDCVAVAAVVEVFADSGLDAGQVVGVDAQVAVLNAVAYFMLAVTEHRLPGLRIDDAPAYDVPIPQPRPAMGNGQCQKLGIAITGRGA